MTDLGCLVIDDLSAALDGMTDLGRSVAAESASTVGQAVLRYACRRGWTVVPHAMFVEWAAKVLERDQRHWLSLDPLFPVDRNDPRLHRVRLRRGAFPGRFVMSSGWAVPYHDGDEVEVGLLDDGAASGSTIHYVTKMARANGASVSSVVVCASTRYARDVLRRVIPRATWVDFMPGDWRIAHLRDGCPHLPFTGACVDPGTADIAEDTWPYVCSPTHSVVGSLWQVLYLDREVKQAIQTARARIVEEMTKALGKVPTVSDMRLLGSNCQAIVERGQTACCETRLETLLASPV